MRHFKSHRNPSQRKADKTSSDTDDQSTCCEKALRNVDTTGKDVNGIIIIINIIIKRSQTKAVISHIRRNMSFKYLNGIF
jgi:hypothetical protein